MRILTALIAWDDNPALSRGLKLPPWSLDQSIEFMGRNNISATILSLGAPATSKGKDSAEAASFCKEINDYTASLRDQHPSQFGFFATLPSLEDTQACIDGIRYSLEVLKADGINLLTSYGGKYLGHPDFRPVWDELNRHAAVVFIHPSFETMEGAIKEPQPLPSPVFDWTHETTRTAVHLITTDTFRTHRECKIILSHGGGTLPYIANRAANLSARLGLMDKSAEEFLDEAKSFYFDLAFAGYEEPLQLLLDFARSGHVLYGSDYPFGLEQELACQLQNIDQALQKREDAPLIARDAALELFPRLKSSQ